MYRYMIQKCRDMPVAICGLVGVLVAGPPNGVVAYMLERRLDFCRGASWSRG